MLSMLVFLQYSQMDGKNRRNTGSKCLFLFQRHEIEFTSLFREVPYPSFEQMRHHLILHALENILTNKLKEFYC